MRSGVLDIIKEGCVMSGICGIVGLENKTLLDRMCNAMRHGEYDDFKTFLHKGISLGGNSLSLTGKKGKDRLIHNEDNSIFVVFDGEIHNYEELKDDLEKKGHKFHHSAEAEVLVHLYEEFGNFFIKRVKGVFCCGIWDDDKKKMILVRDHLGIKSLYYTTIAGSLLFASEIKSILQEDEVKRELDFQSLHYILSLECVIGDGTIFKGINKLLPGHILIYENGKISNQRYWDLSIIISSDKSEDYYVKNILELLKKSVERRMIGNVKIGSFLSGGMDSSSILAVMRSLTDEPIKTFCVGFGESTDDVSENFARIAANHFDTEHHELIINPEDIEITPKVIHVMDMPTFDVTSYMAREFASKRVKLIFGGRGGDELFGGQSRFEYIQNIIPLHNIFPRFISAISSAIISKPVKIQSRYKPEFDSYRRYLRCISSLGNKEKFYLSTIPTYLGDDADDLYSKRVLNENLKSAEDAIRPYFKNDDDFINQTLLAETKTKLADSYLAQADRISLFHSMMEKVPLLDTDLAEFSFTIPPGLKIRDNTRKYIFRKSMRKLLPREVVERRKGGSYGLKPYKLFEGGLREHAMSVLPDSNIVKKGYFKMDYINRVLRHAPNPRMVRHYRLILFLLSLEIWNNMYIDNDDMRKLGQMSKRSLTNFR